MSTVLAIRILLAFPMICCAMLGAASANDSTAELSVGGLTFTRNADTHEMVLTWPDGYQLFSSDEVTGPYQPVADATSPATISFSNPQRFFILRATQ